MSTVAQGLLWYFVFLYSTVFHEAAHAFAALRLGDRTAYDGGQVTFDPIPHIRREPFGTVVVPIVSFLLGGWMIGWASTPYDARWAQRYPRRSALMSLAGPAANLALVLVAALAIRAGIWLGVFSQPDSIGFSSVVAGSSGGIAASLATLVSILFSLNLLLLTFNLLPLPPLDGSSAVGLLLGEKQLAGYLAFVKNPSFSFIGIVVAWKVFDMVFHPIHRLALSLLYPGSHYG